MIDGSETCLKQFKKYLVKLDSAWTQYEKCYVYELMVIEQDARRFVMEAIQVEQEMQEIEAGLERRGLGVYTDDAYNLKRAELVALLAQINSVCNVNGKGRDDLTDISILRAAEQISEQLLVGQAQSVQALADKIRQSLRCFRVLLRKYS